MNGSKLATISLQWNKRINEKNENARERNAQRMYQVQKYKTEIFLQKLHVCWMKMIKNILYKVISIAIYTFFPPLRKVMNATLIKLFVF